MNWKVLIFLLVLYGAYHSWHIRPVSHGDGMIAIDIPQQHKIIFNSKSENINGYQITPLSDFSIQARVLSTEDYSFGRGGFVSNRLCTRLGTDVR